MEDHLIDVPGFKGIMASMVGAEMVVGVCGIRWYRGGETSRVE